MLKMSQGSNPAAAAAAAAAFNAEVPGHHPLQGLGFRV